MTEQPQNKSAAAHTLTSHRDRMGEVYERVMGPTSVHAALSLPLSDFGLHYNAAYGSPSHRDRASHARPDRGRRAPSRRARSPNARDHEPLARRGHRTYRLSQMREPPA